MCPRSHNALCFARGEVPGVDDHVLLSAAIRSLGAAWRALRLYPPGSPMALDVATTTCKAIEDYLQAEPSLRLEVVREGFVLRGLDGVQAAPGIDDLVEALALHGIGELHFIAPPAADELMGLLALVQMQPHQLHEEGGMQKGLAQANVTAIKAVAVTLAKVEALPEIPEEEAERFLQELAGDPNRLAMWLRSLLTADDEGLTEGILTLATAAGDVRVFGRTLALAFGELDADERDRLLESSITIEPLREVMTEMLANLSAVEITAAIRGGGYGASMLSMSYALAALPLGARADEIDRETEEALQAADTHAAQIEFLRRLTSARRAGVAEAPLETAQPYYAAAAAAVVLEPAQLAAAGEGFARGIALDPAGVATLLYLLDSSPDITAYTAVLGAISRAVPALFETGGQALALRVIDEVMHRLASTDKAWEGLDVHFAQAVEIMCGPRSMNAILLRPIEEAVPIVRSLVSLCGEPAALHLAAASIESTSEHSLETAEQVLGRRLAELLAPSAATVDDNRAAKLAELFARDGGPRCTQALRQMAERPEDRVRLETARGMAAAGGPAMYATMPKLLADSSMNVAAFAARMLGHHQTPEAVAILVARLDEVEGDGDLTLARDIISALAASPQPAVDAALERAASKGGRLRKGKYAEVRQLAADAIKGRAAAREGA